MNNKKDRNLWPIAIAVVIFVVVGLIIYTVRLSSALKVQTENTYLSDYQTVDANINELMKSKKLFIQTYAPRLKTEALKIGENELFLEIAGANPSDDLNISFFLTRPHTNVDNEDLGEGIKKENGYASKKFTVEKEGRWRVIVKAVTDINATPAVFSYDINTS